ncbi:MAG: hypothetical protein ACM3WV_03750 [Bacillota bacterium]
MRKHIWFLLIAHIFFFLLLTGCGGTKPGYTASGYVLSPSGNTGVPGVTLDFGGDFGIAKTNEYGIWGKTSLTGGVTITPTEPGWLFDPLNYSVSANENGITFKVYQYFDDFSDSTSCWDVGESPAVQIGYENNQYKMSILANESACHTRSPFPHTDSYQVQVSAVTAAGSGAEYGVVFNHNGSWNSYHWILRIKPDTQEYAVSKRINIGGTVTLDNVIAWTTSANINASGANILKVTQNGSQFSIYLNDPDNAVASGTLDTTHAVDVYAGLLARAYSSSPVHVYFDDYQVTDLSPR